MVILAVRAIDIPIGIVRNNQKIAKTAVILKMKRQKYAINIRVAVILKMKRQKDAINTRVAVIFTSKRQKHAINS